MLTDIVKLFQIFNISLNAEPISFYISPQNNPVHKTHNPGLVPLLVVKKGRTFDSRIYITFKIATYIWWHDNNPLYTQKPSLTWHKLLVFTLVTTSWLESKRFFPTKNAWRTGGAFLTKNCEFFFFWHMNSQKFITCKKEKYQKIPISCIFFV